MSNFAANWGVCLFDRDCELVDEILFDEIAKTWMIKLLENAVKLPVIAGNFELYILFQGFNRYGIRVSGNMTKKGRGVKVFSLTQLFFSKKDWVLGLHDFSEKVEQITAYFVWHWLL